MENFNEQIRNEELKGKHVMNDAGGIVEKENNNHYEGAKHAATDYAGDEENSLVNKVGQLENKDFPAEEEQNLQDQIVDSVCVETGVSENIPIARNSVNNHSLVSDEESVDITGDESYDDVVSDEETRVENFEASNEIEGSKGAELVGSGVILSEADVDRLTGGLGDRDDVPSDNSEDEIIYEDSLEDKEEVYNNVENLENEVVDEEGMGDVISEEIVAADESENEATEGFVEERYAEQDDIDHEAEAERLRYEIENRTENNQNDEYNETEVIDSKEKAETAEKEHIDEVVNEEEFVEEKDSNWDDENNGNTVEESLESPQKIIGGNDSFENVEDSIKYSYSWAKATHVGVCEKCGRNAVKYGLQPKETELNDVELCRDHNRKRNVVRGAIVAGVFAILVFLVIAFCAKWFDPSALNGAYDGISQEDLNAQVADGEMNVSIANTIVFPDGSTNPGRARIYNHQNNHVDQKVAIYMEDSNELLYESGAIAPNQHIDNITLNKELAPGSYKVIAIVTGYKLDSGNWFTDTFDHIFNIHHKVGALGAKINLVVQ